MSLECGDTIALVTEGKGRELSSPEKTISERGNVSGVEGIKKLEFVADALMYDDFVISNLSLETTFDNSASSPCETIETGTGGGSGLPFLSEMITSSHVEQPEGTTGSREETAEDHLGSQIINQTSSKASSIALDNILSQAVGSDQLLDEAAVEGELIPRSHEPFKQAAGETSTLCTERPPFDFRLLSQIPKQFTLQDSFCIDYLVAPSQKTIKLPTNGDLKELVPAAWHQDSSVDGGKVVINSTNNKKVQRKRSTQQNKSSGKFENNEIIGGDVGGATDNTDQYRRMKKPRYPKKNGIPVKDSTDLSLSLCSYNQLLRDARLKECVELLEDMESKKVLDMNKIYHARFLKSCKTQKAVKEAFRFTKLIKKPTLSTFNMLLSVCASSQDYEGAFQVLLLVKEAGLKPDCHLYTTLISTCAKSGKVDAMFEVFHEMVNAGMEPTVHTYGALIDGCARARQVAKAFGAYGIMRSKSVKPDRVIFNALITACGQSGAVDRAFDVLAEMMAEPQPIDPDHVTVGALMRTCIQAGQVDRAHEVYKMLHQYKIKGTEDVYTIAVKSCSLTGDLEFALLIYEDMKQNGVEPDEMFLSTLVDVAGHAGKVEVGFEILREARIRGIQLGSMSYSSLMGACSNAKNWQKALELHEEIKSIQLCPTVSTLNALITALCDGDQLQKATEVLGEMKEAGVHPNTITYSILLVACEKQDEVELGFNLLSQAKEDGILPNLIMCKCLTGLCLRRFEKAYLLGEPILSKTGKPQIDSQWTTWSIMVYRQTISAGVLPSVEAFSQVLGCLKIPNDTYLRNRFVENLGLDPESSKHSNRFSLLDGFGEYDPRSFSMFEEASSLGVVPCVSFKDVPIVVDARKLQIHSAQVYLLTVLKGLKHRLAAGARLPNVTILLPIERRRILSSEGERAINVAGRVGQAVGAMLRRLGLPYQGDLSYGKVRINGLTLRRWFKPKVTILSFGGKPSDLTPSQARLSKEITNQQRSIRSSYSVSLD